MSTDISKKEQTWKGTTRNCVFGSAKEQTAWREVRRIVTGRHNATERLLQQLALAKKSAEPLERLLSRSEAELRRSPEMETLERFVRHMALYFRNVFVAVASYGRILQMRMDQDDPRRTHAQLILDDAKAGRRLAENLLRKKGVTDPRLLTLDRFIRELAPLLSRIVEKRIKLRAFKSLASGT